jgi:hypothetical protein
MRRYDGGGGPDRCSLISSLPFILSLDFSCIVLLRATSCSFLFYLLSCLLSRQHASLPFLEMATTGAHESGESGVSAFLAFFYLFSWSFVFVALLFPFSVLRLSPIRTVSVHLYYAQLHAKRQKYK